MRIFDLKEAVLSLPEERLNATVAAIDRHQAVDAKAAKLPNVEKLKNIAKRSNAVSSCALGNVFLSEQEEFSLFELKAEPTTFEEKTVKGYLDALNLIDQVYDQTDLSVSFISTLHYIMYKEANPAIGGKFKDTQNYIQERLTDGTYRSVFTPCRPEEAYPLLDNLIYQFNECMKDPSLNKLLLIAVFMFEFVAIHPYNHGNGRVSRLVLHFLLKKAGYAIDDYYAVSYLLEKQVSEYIGAFVTAGNDAEDDLSKYRPFCHFLLRIIHAAYRRLEYIVLLSEDDRDLDDRLVRILSESTTPIGVGTCAKILYNEPKALIGKRLISLAEEGRIHRIIRGSKVKYTI